MRSRILYSVVVAAVIAGMFRISAPIAMQGTSLPARTIYNTTDSNTVPVNYERASMGWVANVFTIQATKGGTGTLRGIDFGGTAYRFLLSAGGSTGFSINAATGTVSTYAGTGTIGQGLVAIRGTVLASTGLTGNLGATTVLTGFGSSAGLYKVCFQASTTTSGTGTTGTVTLAWNDGNAKSFTTGTFALNAVDITGQVNGCQTFALRTRRTSP
jgi:CO/xanthine dehydrogenase Mo-binding subunit